MLREAIATNNFEGDPQYDKVIQLLKIASKSVHSAAIAAHRHFSALDKPTFHSTYQHLFGVVANTQVCFENDPSFPFPGLNR
jgi:hypothetical protein